MQYFLMCFAVCHCPSLAQVKDINISELNIAVNDLKGKYVKPTLKKVSKYENKFAKLQKKVRCHTTVS